jgi:NAD(P)-dependent dehydrogenase (short-subunit alcohol dehydrogenase family)
MISFDSSHVFLVTGASSGIGRATALVINALGGTVICVARDEKRLQAVRESCDNPDRFYTQSLDLSNDLDDLPRWMRSLCKEYGKFKGMVLCAGIQQIIPLAALSISQAKELFDINFFAVLALCKGFCDRRVNIGKGSSIVLISSIASITGNSGIIAYSASKGAINASVRSMAVEMAIQGIRVNAVLPGFVETEMIEKWKNVYDTAYIEKMRKKYPLGLGSPEDVADLCCFLLSEKARWITGQEFVIDGGGSLG